MNTNNEIPPSRRATNEQLMLVSILNTMYADNIRLINQYNNRLNLLMEDNQRIRDILIQILYSTGYGSTSGVLNNLLGSPQYIIDIPITRNHRRNGRRNSNTNTFSEVLQGFLDPVEVRPTPSQIEAATRRARFADIVRPLNAQCPISMEDFSDNDIVTVIRSCGHVFHTESLRNWFETNTRCPVCRYDIRDFHISSSSFYDASFNEAQTQALDVSSNLINPNISSAAEMLINILRNPNPNHR